METVGSIQVVATINTKDYDAGKKHIEKGNSDLEKDSDKASSGVSSKWGSVLSSVGVAAAAGFAAATTAVAAFGVSSIKSYAEYEQLIGGVDTLFKSSSNQVQQYAQTAYKTAGLSANAYMTTITGFSASLLQGLGGDTKKAAEIGNMAVTDMADNANKMGTSIEMIQNAYQGFAKQNYTMLDNLKLGYGGTASEMARLINDSGVMGDSMKVTAGTVNSIPFDKQIEAIHKIQTEMEITGTTAKEAAETISGSWSSLTSSWENVKTAIASGNDDLFKGAVDGMIESFGNFSKNIIKVVPNVLGGLVNLIQTVIPQVAPLLTQIISTLLPALVSGAVALLNSLVAMIPTIIPILLQALPAIINGAVQLFLGLVQALPIVVQQLTEALPTIIDTVVNALTDPKTIITILTAAIAVFMALVEAIPTVITALQESIPTIITNIVKVLTDPKFIAMMLMAGFTLIVALFDGFIKVISNIPKYIGQIVSGIIDHFTKTDWGKVGSDIITGIGNGLVAAKDAVIGTIKDIAKNALDAVKNFFGIKSPSRVMRDQVGKMIGEGMGIGITKSTKAAVNAAESSSRAILDAFDTTSGFSSGLISDEASGLSGSIVHKGEYVVPKEYVNQSTGLPKQVQQTSQPTQNATIVIPNQSSGEYRQGAINTIKAYNEYLRSMGLPQIGVA